MIKHGDVHKSDYCSNNFHVTRRGDTLAVELTYPPRNDEVIDRVTYVEVDQESVRASGGIRIHFDYERNGFVVEQAMNWAGVPQNTDGTFDEMDYQFAEVGFFDAFHKDAKGLDE